MIEYLATIIPKRFSVMASITNLDLPPSMQAQHLVRALLFLFVAIILTLSVLHAIRVKRKALREEKSVEFSSIKEHIASYRWGFIGLGQLCAIIFVLLFFDQTMKLIRIMVD